MTLPGTPGPQAAFLAELLISFGLMTVVLTVSNTPHDAVRTWLRAVSEPRRESPGSIEIEGPLRARYHAH